MSIPIGQASAQSGRQFNDRFDTMAFAGQGAQLFLPRLNQVQPTRILRNELDQPPKRRGLRTYSSRGPTNPEREENFEMNTGMVANVPGSRR